jgi:hypothetical protein
VKEFWRPNLLLSLILLPSLLSNMYEPTHKLPRTLLERQASSKQAGRQAAGRHNSCTLAFLVAGTGGPGVIHMLANIFDK